MSAFVAWLRWAIEHLRQWLRPPTGAPTGGGTAIGGNVTVGRDFVGRDRLGQGDDE